MTKFVPTRKLTYENRQQVSEMSGKIILWILEGRSTAGYMADQLGLKPWEVEENIFEMAHTCIRWIGWKKFIKILLCKKHK